MGSLLVVPTLSFRLLYGLLILNHGRRQILLLGVTAHPTAEWIARPHRGGLTEACGWDGTPEYLVRDHDSVYGAIFTRRVRAMGIRDRPIGPRSPWQNGHAERLIGSLRRECLDHVIVMGERHLRQLLGLLQQSADTLILEQRCAGAAGHSSHWKHPREPNSRRITSSLMFGFDFPIGTGLAVRTKVCDESEVAVTRQ
jgi:transposase InsO family protein